MKEPRARGHERPKRRAPWVLLLILLALACALVRPDIPRDELITRYGQPPSHFMDVEGMSVHYRDEGTGPPLVLIHGTSSSLHTWDGWVERLKGHRRIVRFDLPGFGLTGPAPDQDYRASRYARVVATVMSRLGISKADIAGNSLGGRVALTFALEHPERVRKLVLVDASGLRGQRPPSIFKLARTPFLSRVLTLATPRFLVKKNVLEVYGDPSRASDALIDRYADMTRGAGNRGALLDRLNGPPDPDLDDWLKELHMPVLLLWGDKDPWIPLSFGERFRDAIPGSKLVVIEGAGHVPMEEEPEKTAQAVDQFLGE